MEVTEGAHRVATLSELGGTDPSAANVAVVKFTVRHAGQYKISVIIGSCHVHGSPFVKTFLPGKLFLKGNVGSMVEFFTVLNALFDSSGTLLLH